MGKSLGKSAILFIDLFDNFALHDHIKNWWVIQKAFYSKTPAKHVLVNESK